MYNAEIITIGDEILIGQVIDTNSAWIAQQLNLLGINVAQITSVSDDKIHIINSLNDATLRANLIIVTGGLGPTNDDITKPVICEYFKTTLVRNTDILKHITKLLEPRGVKINSLNEQQADVPQNAFVLFNSLGTAPGLWFEKDNHIYVFLPGVPFEMKQIFAEYLKPKLELKYKTGAVVHHTLMLQGIAESMLAQHIQPWESKLPAEIKLAYLPSPGLIRLRLTAKGSDKEKLENLIQKEIENLKPLITNWYYADNDETIEVTIGKILKTKGKTLSIAESCTGGKIAHLITSISGSSEYFKGSIVSYANEIKSELLQIPAEIITQNGAVSQSVVELMAKNCCHIFNTDFAIATSGIAGPDGGTPDKPVGTVWIAVSSKEKVISKKLSLGDTNRERNIHRASLSVLGELRKFILSETR